MNSGLSPLRLSVRTQSGRHLGTVVDLTIDPDTQGVLAFHVKPSRLVPDMVWSPLIIGRDQVIDITPEGMVVDDAVDRAAQRTPNPQPTN